jgi:NAD(P)-dependent dehydrogenase (short-subunit alcohol dehydrogenase family)
VDPFPADMYSQAEVRRLAREVLAAYPRLDVLVNNVGGFWATRRVTTDGLERTFAVNHLAPFLLTGLLPDRLKDSAPARVVTVSSKVVIDLVKRCHRRSVIDMLTARGVL